MSTQEVVIFSHDCVVEKLAELHSVLDVPLTTLRPLIWNLVEALSFLILAVVKDEEP